VKKIDEALEPLNDTMVRRYQWQKWTFIAGFALLIASRAYFPVARIVLAVVRRETP
jgi:hypothetical protein